MFPFYNDNTAASPIGVTTSDVNAKSVTIPQNQFSKLVVTSDLKIVTAGGSTAQSITLKVKIGTTVAANTKSYTVPIAAATATHNYTLTHVAELRAPEVVSIAVVGPGADAVTAITVNSLNIYGI